MDINSKEMSVSQVNSQDDVENRIQKIKNSLKQKNFFQFKQEIDEEIVNEQPQLDKATSSQFSKINTEVNAKSQFLNINANYEIFQKNQRVFADINTLIDRKTIDIHKIYEVITAGIVFEVIVLRKDEKQRNLTVILNRFHSICDQCNLQNMKEEDIRVFREKKQQLEELLFIQQYRVYATIKESELLEYFSIFSNDFNFTTIQEGDELFAVVIKNQLFGLSEEEKKNALNSNEKEIHIELSCKNEILQNSKFLSIQNVLDPKTYDPNSDLFVRLGAKSDNNVKIQKADMIYFEKYGIFPYDLQIRRCTSLKNIVKQFYDMELKRVNQQLYQKSNRQNMIRFLKLKENNSLNSQFTNKNLIQEIQIDYKRKLNS